MNEHGVEGDPEQASTKVLWYCPGSTTSASPDSAQGACKLFHINRHEISANIDESLRGPFIMVERLIGWILIPRRRSAFVLAIMFKYDQILSKFGRMKSFKGLVSRQIDQPMSEVYGADSQN
jgi:hypothetical protein